jgi:CRISPR system Cascade subunit CasA
MNPSCNLIDEPWIPCIDLQGRAVTLGLGDTLAQAHRLQNIVGDSPLVTAALHRLLLAVIHSALRGPASRRGWADLWQAGCWDMRVLGDYLDRWYNRFDLFHPERPFYQSEDLRVGSKSIISLIPEMASGNNATLFDHHTEEGGEAFRPARAARALVAAQTFGLAGLCNPKHKLYFTDAPWARGIVFLIEGDTLFQTLMLNLLRYNQEEPLPAGENDAPAWEQNDPLQPDREVPLGYLDYLTWQNRRIMLYPEQPAGEKWIVRETRMAPGLRLTASLLDPMKHYRLDEKRGELVWRFREDRVLWRDSSALFQLNAEGHRPPLNFRWVANLVERLDLDPASRYRFAALGMASNKAKVDFFRQEHIPLPLAYFREKELGDALKTALEQADDVRRFLGGAVSALATLLLSPTAYDDNGRKPDPNDVANLRNHWGVERRYWGRLEVSFLELVNALPGDCESALETWKQTLQRAAWEAFDQAQAMAGTDAKGLRATVRAGDQLAAGLTRLFPKPETAQPAII